jgi:glycosyltransferase involved in cell wall biosynthesis
MAPDGDPRNQSRRRPPLGPELYKVPAANAGRARHPRARPGERGMAEVGTMTGWVPGRLPDPESLAPGRRILMLVPHEPSLDPRIAWSIQVCADYARTQVVALDSYSKPPPRTYDGVVSVEADSRERFMDWAPVQRVIRGLLRRWSWRRAFEDRTRHPHERRPDGRASQWAQAWRGLVYHVGGLAHSAFYITDLKTALVRPMVRRAETVFVPPALIVCHDLWSLEAGIRLKQRFGCPLVYDNHEYSPQVHLSGHPLEEAYWERYERRLCRSVDAFITVTPELAALAEQKYGLGGRAFAVPNAAPLSLPRAPSNARPVRLPVTFLVQGVASPGRGFEALLDSWGRLKDPRARLWLRCPENDYLAGLRRQYAPLVETGSLAFLPPVAPADLIEAATGADVGIIPYPVRVGERKVNYNHLYCCPNKLSEYMQAGLAILSTNTRFVSGCLQRYQCGATYDPEQADALADAVRTLVASPEALERMKDRASYWARTDYHWDRQAETYRAVIESLTGLTRQPARAAPGRVAA